MIPWIEDHPELLWAAAVFSAVLFLASLVVIPALIVRIPPDYFRYPDPPPGRWADRHPVLRLTVLVAKNALGAVLFVAGLAMLVLPGQGVLTLFVALMLLDFPGKRNLERRFIARPRVLRTLNWIRKQTDHPPLERPEGL